MGLYWPLLALWPYGLTGPTGEKTCVPLELLFPYGDVMRVNDFIIHAYENLDSIELRRVLIELVSTPGPRRLGREGGERPGAVPPLTPSEIRGAVCCLQVVQRGSVHETSRPITSSNHQNKPRVFQHSLERLTRHIPTYLGTHGHHRQFVK